MKTQIIWLWTRITSVLGPESLHYLAPRASAAIIALGAILMIRRERDACLVLVAPMCTAVLASAFKFYIFRGPYLTFLLPSFFILAAAGVEAIRNRLATVSRPLGVAWMLACMSIPIGAIAQYPPPYRLQEMKPVLAYVSEHRQNGDGIYAFFAAWHAMWYYGPRYGLSPGTYVLGECHDGEAEKYFAELDQFRGKPRVWVIVVHDRGRYQAREEIVNYLARIGTLRDSIVITRPPLAPYVIGAYGYLYDLSDSTRLASTTAAEMPLLRPRRSKAGPTCGGIRSSAETP